MAGGVTSPFISSFHLESICQMIAETDDGLKGSEIGKILADCQMKDTDPTLTKWKRLYNSFVESQNRLRNSNEILQFIRHAMHPTRYFGQDEIFQRRLNELNKRLSFIGIKMTDSATYENVSKANTLSEAQQRASHYKYKLEIRNVHPDIVKYCNAELLTENYFHSIFEAVKSVAERIRTMTGLYADGNVLADVAFSTAAPLIRINLLRDDTERSEHIGFCNLIKALFGLIRNPTAHTPKIKFTIDEEEALDIMTMVSFVHRKLDKAL